MYALITGASSGLGKQLAIQLANKGYNLILVARREDKLNKLKEQLSDKVKVLVKTYDLSIIDNCHKLFQDVSGIDIALWINNAGFGHLGLYTETNLEKELQMIDLNIKALVINTKLYIKNYNKGIVVNIGSLAGDLPTPKHSIYSASKSFVNNFSRAINYELRKTKSQLRVLTVAPGPVKTEFNEVANAKINRGMSQEKCAKIIISGIERKKDLIIPGFSNKLAHLILKVFPSRLALRFAYKIQDSK